MITLPHWATTTWGPALAGLLVGAPVALAAALILLAPLVRLGAPPEPNERQPPINPASKVPADVLPDVLRAAHVAAGADQARAGAATVTATRNAGRHHHTAPTRGDTS